MDANTAPNFPAGNKSETDLIDQMIWNQIALIILETCV